MDPRDRIVAAQGAALIALAWPGRPCWTLPRTVARASAAALLAGGSFAAAAAAPHGRRLTPRVAPPADHELLEDGPYAVSRHPIYTGLLAAGAGWAVLRRRPEPLLAWLALTLVLVRKTHLEEHELHRAFGDRYARYAARTPRLLGRRRGVPQQD